MFENPNVKALFTHVAIKWFTDSDKSLNSTADLHYGHLKALHSSMSMYLSAKCVFCLFSTQPSVPLSANTYCLIIVMCVSNCLVCYCDAPSNFNQILNNGALECVQPSMSAYHICPFTTRVCAEYKSKALHYLESERGERQRERIQSNSLVNCDPVWSAWQWSVLYWGILKKEKPLTAMALYSSWHVWSWYTTNRNCSFWQKNLRDPHWNIRTVAPDRI